MVFKSILNATMENNNNGKGIQMNRITGILIVIGTMALVLISMLTLSGRQINCMASQINERIDSVEARYNSNLLRIEEIQIEHVKQITALEIKINGIQVTLNRIEQKLP